MIDSLQAMCSSAGAEQGCGGQDGEHQSLVALSGAGADSVARSIKCGRGPVRTLRPGAGGMARLLFH